MKFTPADIIALRDRVRNRPQDKSRLWFDRFTTSGVILRMVGN